MQTFPETIGFDVPLAAAHRAAMPREQGKGASAFDGDAQFVALLNSFRHSGGLARAADVSASMQQRGAHPIASLARWIVARELLHFEWQGESWLPLFQFSGDGLQPHPAVGKVLAELADVMPAWEVAQWFAQPNSALAGCRPADGLAADAPAVVQAARADRYLIDA